MGGKQLDDGRTLSDLSEAAAPDLPHRKQLEGYYYYYYYCYCYCYYYYLYRCHYRHYTIIIVDVAKIYIA